MEELERDVTASPQEFLRGVRAAFPGRVLEAPGLLRIDDDGITLEISYVPGPPRIIAALELPTLRVILRFAGGTKERRAGMLAHMDRVMQRGGG